MSGSNGAGTPKQRLAVAAYERRQAIFEAGADSVIPPAPRVPTLTGIGPRDKLPTLDDLTGPEAPKARWKLALAVGSAVVALAELVRQIAGLVGTVK